MRLFIKKIFLFFLLSLIIIFILLINNRSADNFVYDYQIRKIKEKEKESLSTIMIGDSSLGNAIDGEEFSRLSSQGSANCALSGIYGYAGSYNILKTAHRYHPEMKNVIVMHSPDMQTRPVSFAGYARTADSFDDFWELSNGDRLAFMKELFNSIKSSGNGGIWDSRNLAIKDDYVVQAPKKEDYDTEPLKPEDIDPDKNIFLEKIAGYCSANDLNLIYINGPIYDKKAEASGPYLDSINRNFSSMNLSLIPDVITVEKSDLGDRYDHIRPDLRNKYTEKYYGLIKKYLK